MNQARYAIYAAPHPDSALWRFGSDVLGYDAATGQETGSLALAGRDAAAWRELTRRPRSYGFHGTLKAPFRLAEGHAARDLEADMFDHASRLHSFAMGPLGVTSLSDPQDGGFVALVPVVAPPELQGLEAGIVRHFDKYRAPSTPQEIARRNPSALTERQQQSLARHGYPFTGADYRFHMTLTGHAHDADAIADCLATEMANRIGTARMNVDALVLFAQPAPDKPFHVIARAPFSTGMA